MLASGVVAVVFDYGSTLVEFSRAELARMDAGLGDALERAFGHVDRAELVRRRNLDRVAPYREPYRENDLPAITVALIEGLYGVRPAQELVDEILVLRRRLLVEAVVPPDGLAGELERIAGRYRLGLLSNYPCSETIRESVRTIGIGDLFDAIVVSADVGRVKPHPLPFTTIAERLEVAAGECLMVGDNWLGDVQGAKRAGMRAVHCTRFETPESFPPRAGDQPADATVASLAELASLLGV